MILQLFRVDATHIRVVTRCPMCKENSELVVLREGFDRWRDGELIQAALPDLSVDDRERLINGMCSTCWKKLFKV